jgi:hypothetical protein
MRKALALMLVLGSTIGWSGSALAETGDRIFSPSSQPSA